MGQRKDSIRYISSRLQKKDFKNFIFETNYIIDVEKNRDDNLKLNFLHRQSKTVILVGVNQETQDTIQGKLDSTFQIFNIKKESYKNSWKQQKQLLLDSLKSKYVSTLVSNELQPSIIGGLKEVNIEIPSAVHVEKNQKEHISHQSATNTAKQIDITNNINTDLIGKTPGWILNSGLGIIGLAVLIFLVFAFFIRYPDKLTAQGYVYNETPPVEHLFKVDGIIEEIFVMDGDIIEEEQAILYIKNDVALADYRQFIEFIDKFSKTGSLKMIGKIDFPLDLNLGEFASAYSSLQVLLNELQQTLAQEETFARINVLKSEITKTKELSEIIAEDKRLLNEELQLSQKNLSRYENLNKEGAVSDLETEQEYKSNLQLLKEINGSNRGIIENQIGENQMLLEIQKLREERKSKINSQLYSISELIILIRNSAKIWEEKYFLCAEISGKIQFNNQLHNRFQGSKNKLAFTISPSMQKDIFVKLDVPSQGIGKIKEGDKVILKFNAYPYKEFGFVTSKIDLISDLPRIVEGQYLFNIEVGLEDKIITSTGFEIPISPFTELQAEIITKDYSILKRIAQKASPIIK